MHRLTATPQPIGLHPRWGRGLRWALWVATVALALALVVQLIGYGRYQAETTATAAHLAQAEADAAAAQLSAIFAQSEQLAERLAAGLSSGAIPYHLIEGRVSAALQRNATIDGITVAFAPQAFSDAYERYIVYISRAADGVMQIQVGESRYDYTVSSTGSPNDPATAWYTRPIVEGPQWTEPFRAAGAGKVLIEYGVPFYRVDDPTTPAGVVAVDYTLDGMRQLVNDLDLGATGFGVVVSAGEVFLAHPVPSEVTQSAFRAPAETALRVAVQRGLAGERYSFERRNAQTGELVWNFVTPIESTGWVLGVELPQADFLPEPRLLLLRQTWLLLTAAALAITASALAVRVETGNPRPLWRLSLITSGVLLVVLLLILALARTMPRTYGVPIRNPAELNTYLQTITTDATRAGLPDPVTLPTGLLLQAIRFPDATSVVLSGYVWQRVPLDLVEEITPGVTFPQRIDEPYQIEQVAAEQQGDEIVYVWELSVALRQIFNPEQYPLDVNDVRIRLLPTEVAQHVLLVPDLEGYTVTLPEARPGLDSTILINNWVIQRSFFSYERNDYQTTLGFAGRPAMAVPELNFNIRTERQFVGPFITFVLPAIVTAILIFAFLMNGSKPDEPEEIVSALNYSAALFFVIAVLHTALRENAAAIGLTYLEYFYLLLYVLLLGVAANTFLVVRQPQLPFIRFGNNLIAKATFWPLLLGMMTSATLWMFVFRGE